MNASELLIVFSTVQDKADGERIAKALLEEKLCACVNIIPAIQSIYRWKGKIENTTEQLLVIKSTQAAYPKLEMKIRQLHSYEVPEIVALPAAAAFENYLSWVMSETTEGV